MVQRGVRPESLGGTTGIADDEGADAPEGDAPNFQTSSAGAPRGLERLGRSMVRHRRLVVVVWLVVVIGLGALSKADGDPFRDVFSVPGANSQSATNLLNSRFPAQQQPSAQIVVNDRTGPVTDPGTQRVVNAALATVAKLPGVATVSYPFTPPARVSANGRIALATVRYRGAVADLPKHAFDQLEKSVAPIRATGLRVELGGPVVDLQNQQSATTHIADAIAMLAAVMILLFVFGSMLAALLPIGVALSGVILATAILTLIAGDFTEIGRAHV